VGFFAESELRWQRWWHPFGDDLTLWNGMLPDPNGPSSKFLNRSLQPLAATDAYRARILLAEPGMGKSHELNVEVERLGESGSYVELIDLGDYGDGSDLRETLRAKARDWNASGADELVLALDSFDEPLLDIAALAGNISRCLEAIGPGQLRLLIASRTSLWDSSLEVAFRRWWGPEQVRRLTLAPLTEADVKLAAASAVDDPDTFLRDVVDRGAAAFAARPVTLGLLLATAQNGQLPATRTGIYDQGIQALAAEPGDRRKTSRRRREPVPAQQAGEARRLAAVTLLSGHQTIARRSISSPAYEVALNLVVEDGVSLPALESVWDSALLSGGPEQRTWSHRTIEEYLAASQLAQLPLPTAIRLLTVPNDHVRLVPQFQETAAWLAWLSEEAFDWLINQQPQTVITPDLRTADHTKRARVAAAVVDNLRSGTPLRQRDGYEALKFDGLGDLLRPLLDDGEPGWRQHEVLLIIAATQIRSIDDRLIELVENASHGGPSRADDDVDVARAAVYALRGTDDSGVHSRLRAVIGDGETPTSLRALVLELFWPDMISTAQLLDAIEPEHRFAFQNLRNHAINAFRMAIEDGRVAARDLVEWFRSGPDELHEDSTAKVAARVALDALSSAERPSERWDAAIDLVDKLLTATGDRIPWSADDVRVLPDPRRRHLVHDLLRGWDVLRAEALRDGGMIRQDDLDWWFDTLASDLDDGGRDDGLSARAVIELVVEVADSERAARAGREAVDRHAVLAPVVEELFAPAIVQRREERRQLAARRSATNQLQPVSACFDKAAFSASATVGDFPALLEVINPGSRMSGYAGANRPVEGWQDLDESECDMVAAAALSFLLREHDDDEYDIGWLGGRAYDVVWAYRRDALVQVTGAAWTSLLPYLLAASDNHRVIAHALPAASSHDREAAVRVVVRQIEAEVVQYGRVYVAGRLGTFQDAGIGAHALRLVSAPDVPPRAVDSLLTLGVTMTADPGVLSEAVAITRTLMAACPTQSPDRNDDAVVASWTRTVGAIVAIMPSKAAPELFNEVLALFHRTPALFVDVVRPNRSRDLFSGLNSPQIAELFLWARHQFPPRRVQPGVMFAGDSVDDAVGYLPDLLRKRRDHEAIDALQTIAAALSNVHLAAEVAQLRDEVRVSERGALSPRVVLEILNAPQRWSITTASDLAALIIEVLGDLQHDLHRDRALRSQVWHRQRRGNRWSGHVPMEELELSTWLRGQLGARLQDRVALLREVQIQPRLGDDKADHPDIVAVTVNLRTGEQVQLPIEVKCSWHDDVIDDLSDQLIKRYLGGPLGREGIYIVGHFNNDDWPEDDASRRTAARKYSCADLKATLVSIASTAPADRRAHVFVIDLPLDINETRKTTG
jgi:hypothetical protein